MVVDINGTELLQSAYYPFGIAFQKGGNVNKYLYNGKELQEDEFEEASLDWHDNGFRMYDANIGRWHIKNPLGESMSNVSPYSYCFNNPLLYTDLPGLIPRCNWDTRQYYEDINGDGVQNGGDYNISFDQAMDYYKDSSDKYEATHSYAGSGNSLYYKGTVWTKTRSSSGTFIPNDQIDIAQSNGGAENWAGVLTFAGPAAAIDGPIPFGDMVAASVVVTYGIYDVASRIHANCNRNPKPHLVYAITSMDVSGAIRVEKYGITSRKDNVDGNNGRPAYQANKFNKMDPTRA